MITAYTAEMNILAVLKHHGITGLRVVSSQVDRIFCADDNCGIEDFLEGKRELWVEELPSTAALNHSGAVRSWREKNVSPALQIILLDNGQLELDLDFYAPQHLSWRIFAHALEVLRNKFTGGKTNQNEIALRLKKNRGIEAVLV